jgi:hypothetical protein
MEVKEPNGSLEDGGHVAVVNTVTATGNGVYALQLVNQNATSVLTTGTWSSDTDTIGLPASGGWTYPVNGVVHAPGSNAPSSSDSSGTVFDSHNNTLYMATQAPGDTLALYWDPIGQAIHGPLYAGGGTNTLG